MAHVDTALGKRKGQWYNFDDETVAALSDASKICSPYGYLLFYRKVRRQEAESTDATDTMESSTKLESSDTDINTESAVKLKPDSLTTAVKLESPNTDVKP